MKFQWLKTHVLQLSILENTKKLTQVFGYIISFVHFNVVHLLAYSLFQGIFKGVLITHQIKTGIEVKN